MAFYEEKKPYSFQKIKKLFIMKVRKERIRNGLEYE